MSRLIVIVLTLAALAGCGHQMASCKGPLVALNPGLWQPAPSDLKE